MVDDMGWWTIPMVSLVIFTLYGIEGIGSQLEDPFGYDRNDIKMDAIVGDAKTEVDVVLDEWRKTMALLDVERSNDVVGTDPRAGSDAGITGFVLPEMFLRRDAVMSAAG